MKTKSFLLAALVGVAAVSAVSANAGVSWNISIGLPLPVVYAPPVAVYAPAPQVVYAQPCPPPAPPVIVETVPACPGPDYVWVGSCWNYRPTGYVWVHGGWRDHSEHYARNDYHANYGGGRRW